MRKIVLVLIIFVIFGMGGCFFFDNYKEPNVVQKEDELNLGIESDNVAISTSVPATPTPMPTIDDVEIYFDKNLVTFTSKEESETVYLNVDLNGYMGELDYEYDVTGYGNVNITAGKSEIEPGKFSIPLYISPIENCVLIITYKIKGTYESTDITIVTNFFDE